MPAMSNQSWSFASSYSYSSIDGKEQAEGPVKETKNGATFTAANGKMLIKENGQQREEPWQGKKSLAQAWTRPTLREIQDK
jgi:hypothetical protein